MSATPLHDPTAAPLSDAKVEIRNTTCYMCACRCGIRVHLRNGEVRYIEGNPDHPLNQGVICAKGSSGIMKQYSPARLTKPLLRKAGSDRGEGQFEEIEWQAAYSMLEDRLRKIRSTDPKKFALFTGRDQMQALTGLFARQFGTPNYAAHGGFCSVNMAAGMIYTIGGSFWEFGGPDLDRAKLFVMIGTAEDHHSNPMKAALSRFKRGGGRFVSVNPVRTGYSAIADEWIPIKPGTDGALLLSLIHELIRLGLYDREFLARYTNAGQLVNQDAASDDFGMMLRKSDGDIVNPLRPANFYWWDRLTEQAVSDHAEGADPALLGHFKLPDGTAAVPAFQLLEERVNGFQTIRSLAILMSLLGTIDRPGGFRHKAPYPRAVPPNARPPKGPQAVKPDTPLDGAPLGWPESPDDLFVDDQGQPVRIDKGFSWEHPLSAHGLMHNVITNAWRGDPYRIDTLLIFMANMAWNSTMNTSEVRKMLNDKHTEGEQVGEYKIPFLVVCDAFQSEMTAFADLILPDTTYLERHDCMSMLDRPISEFDGPVDAVRIPVLPPKGECKPFQEVLVELAGRLKLPAFTQPDGSRKFKGYTDFIVNYETAPGSGIGFLAGWRGKGGEKSMRGEPNPRQWEMYEKNNCVFHHEMPVEYQYMRNWNRGYMEWAQKMGIRRDKDPIVIHIYSEFLQGFRLAAQGKRAGKQPPDTLRKRVETYFDPLPFHYVPLEEQGTDTARYPLNAITQRPMAMYHSWDSQNAWLRQIHTHNYLFVNPKTAGAEGIADGGWMWVESQWGKVRCMCRYSEAVEPGTVWTWNAIGKSAGAWNLTPDANESQRGFLLNHLISEELPASAAGASLSNSDPITGQAAWYDVRVRIYKAAADEPAQSWPQFKPVPLLPGVQPAPARWQAWFAGRGVRK